MSRRSLLLLLPADARKSRLVFESLLAAEAFRDRYETSAVVDGSAGRVVDALEASDTDYEVAETPSEPTSAIARVAAGQAIDVLVSCGWTELIPGEAIDRARVAALNCHGSYLPDDRGPATHRLHWARADRTGGATVHVLTEEFDDGRILCREQFDIAVTDTPGAILRRSSRLCAVLLREALLLVEDDYEGVANDDGTYHSLVPWWQVATLGSVNHVLRAAGTDRRVGFEGVSPR